MQGLSHGSRYLSEAVAAVAGAGFEPAVSRVMSPVGTARLPYPAACLAVGFEPTYRSIPAYDGESLRVSAVPRSHLVLCTEDHLPSGGTQGILPDGCSTRLSYANVEVHEWDSNPRPLPPQGRILDRSTIMDAWEHGGGAVTVGVSPVLFAQLR